MGNSITSPDDIKESGPNPEQDEIDRQARIAYLKSLTPAKRRSVWPVVTAAILAIVVIVAGLYFFVLEKKFEVKKAPTSSQSQQSNTGSDDIDVGTEHFNSTTFSLGFDYPKNWTVKEEGGKLTARSTIRDLKDTSGKTVKGQILLTIQPKQASLEGFKKGNGVAVRDSEKITYTSPTQNQRAQTYVTFVNYAHAAEGIDAVYITGDLGYQKSQAVPEVDIVRVDPLISTSFIKCASSDCSGPSEAFTIPANSWSEAAYLTKSIRTILTTLSIQ